MRIAIGCDSAAYELKKVVIQFLVDNNVEYSDFGILDSSDETKYPIIAENVAVAVAEGNFQRGILLCGTGIGMNITANKIPGVYSAVCHDCYSAERSIKSNNIQILCMGARVIGAETAKMVLRVWLNASFNEGSSSSKLAIVENIDKKYREEETPW